MGLIDSHAHLTAEPLDSDVDGVLGRAVRAGVDQVISVGVDLKDSQRALAWARRDERVLAAIGIHPHEAAKPTSEDWTRLAELAADPVVVAVGETGLDYHYDLADRSVQQAVFERQLELAAASGKPVVIHCREAHGDTMAILKASGLAGKRVVFHCFSGTRSQARDIADHGWRVSFTGVVTFKNAGDLPSIAADYPIGQLMIETDSPFLSPTPVRHVKPNEPAHLIHIARFLADLRGMRMDEFIERTADATRAFFNLPDAHRREMPPPGGTR